MMAEFTVRTAEETQDLVRRLARFLQAGDLLVLTGGLGAGKTTFTQGDRAGLEVAGQIASPTSVIARTHATAATQTSGPIRVLVHVDAYRLESLEEVDALDLDASFDDSVTVVEWGEGMVEQLSADRLAIEIRRPRGAERDLDDDTRIITFAGHGERWQDVPLADI